MKKITYVQATKAFPKLKQVKLNGSTDFNTVAEIIGSRNPNYVWPIVNAITSRMSSMTSPALAKLFED
jgi:hypothetical protein